MSNCDLLDKCGFFQKHAKSHQAACQGLVTLYCKGPKQNECKRKEYRKKHGQPPPDDMLPGGAMLRS
ncbi:hypothetical protein [Dethiosulfatarculus sandiegensis]|uniref:Uncharacterized protein n=1 Tax=Dethiosulfatarculus sandiegensis TaxID=1429043 RepID=A0A0D2HT79_9BACT|nr:hypothetical protein [Dethiosulfatarculus sandiegensis]KIX13738.1 hypothetical protein X474_12430 [Dethiosulfatarculus sandiegensis]